jgi:hypothetical protein
MKMVPKGKRAKSATVQVILMSSTLREILLSNAGWLGSDF